MISIDEFAPQTMRVRLKGRLTEADLDQLEQALRPYLPDEGSVNAVLEFSDWSGIPSFAANHYPQPGRLLAQLDKLGRVALVGDGAATGKLADALGAVMPPGSFGHFDPVQRAQAARFVEDRK